MLPTCEDRKAAASLCTTSIFAYGTLRPDAVGLASWTEIFNNGAVRRDRAILPNAALFQFGKYPAVAIPDDLGSEAWKTVNSFCQMHPKQVKVESVASDPADHVRGWVITFSDTLWPEKLALADTIESCPTMYERIVRNVVVVDEVTGEKQVTAAVVYHRTSDVVREVFHRSSDQLFRIPSGDFVDYAVAIGLDPMTLSGHRVVGDVADLDDDFERMDNSTRSTGTAPCTRELDA